jgi:hypothetical protein
MNALRTRHLLLMAATVALCLPAAAAAESVPAGNPAAIQYTETFPSAGGPRNAEGPRKGNDREPAKVLGQHNAQNLEAQGAAGRDAARLAAETAPAPIVSGTGSASSGGSQTDGQGTGGGSKAHGGGNSGNAAGGSSNSGGGEGGSSLGEVLGQATGSSSGGGISPLLPLVIFATVVWSLAYLLRQRRSQAE